MKEKRLSPDCGSRQSLGGGAPRPAKTDAKAGNHSKEGPKNATVGKSGVIVYTSTTTYQHTIRLSVRVSVKK